MKAPTVVNPLSHLAQSCGPAGWRSIFDAIQKDPSAEELLLEMVKRACQPGADMEEHATSLYDSLNDVAYTLLNARRFDALIQVRQIMEAPTSIWVSRDPFKQSRKALHEELWVQLLSADMTPWGFSEKMLLMPSVCVPIPTVKRPNTETILWWLPRPAALAFLENDPRATAHVVGEICHHCPERLTGFLESLPQTLKEEAMKQGFINAISKKGVKVQDLLGLVGTIKLSGREPRDIRTLLEPIETRSFVIERLLKERPLPGDTFLEQGHVAELASLKEVDFPFTDFRYEGGFTLAHAIATNVRIPHEQGALLWLAGQYPEMFQVVAQGKTVFDVARNEGDPDPAFSSVLDHLEVHLAAQALERSTRPARGISSPRRV